MKNNTLIAYSLVFIQFACIGLIFITGPLVAGAWYLLFIEVVGIILGVWAVSSMNTASLSAMPLVKKNAVLSFRGPYKIIRHPMYLSLILVTGTLIINHFTLFRGLILAILIINLFIKIHFEEKQLMQFFPSYDAYRKKTFKIIPFIL